MKIDPFEKQLQARPFRPIPPEWQDQILAAAKAHAPGPIARVQPLAWLRELLWPCPQAWAVVAAAWVLILALHLADPATESLACLQLSSITEVEAKATVKSFQAQCRLRDELIGANDFSQPIEEPKRAPLPRSQTTTQFILV